MVSYHNKLSRACKKRKYGVGGKPAETVVGAVKRKLVGVKGGGVKVKLFAADFVNAVIGGKVVKCPVAEVKENPANKDYVRRGVITKGAIVTAKGPDGKEISVRITSKPGQDGVLNGVVV